MDNGEIIERLEHKGVKATPNRILIYKALHDSGSPLSLADMEDKLLSIDKSSIFRVLTLFVENDVAHSFSDGRGVVHYELCSDTEHCHHDNDHVHFYCDVCHKSYCIDDVPVPEVALPEGFVASESSYVITGQCPECSQRKR